VAPDGQAWRGELGCFDDAQVPGLARIAQALRQRGAASILQIFHGGARADSSVSGLSRWSASALEEGVRAGGEEDLARVVVQFAEAAARAERAGMDGVEVHGAHGYLFTQFLSSTLNQRTDGWGGSLENRARLLRETVRAIRARVSSRFTVGVRLSPESYAKLTGLDLDESLQVGAWLAADGADFLHLSLWKSSLPSLKRPDEHALQAFRRALPVDVRLLVAGAVWTRAEAEALLSLGADGVALGRSAIGNPSWPLAARDPAWQPERPPYSVANLRAKHLTPRFAEYMRQWPGFVS